VYVAHNQKLGHFIVAGKSLSLESRVKNSGMKWNGYHAAINKSTETSWSSAQYQTTVKCYFPTVLKYQKCTVEFKNCFTAV